MSPAPASNIPSDDAIARAWHALSDEPLDAIPFEGEGCNCRNFAPYARRVLELFYAPPAPEPEGLGAVALNPYTGDIWVRAAHPALPWHDPSTTSPQTWSDPTSERWRTWSEVEQPVVIQNYGWIPPDPPRAPTPQHEVPEPTGVGAVVEAGGETWIRAFKGTYPWIRSGAQPGSVARWEDLERPVDVRNHGWSQR